MSGIEESVAVVDLQPRRSPRTVARKPAAAVTLPSSKKGKRAQPEEIIGSPEVTAELPIMRPESEPKNRSLAGITAEAKKLREQNPSKYGIKGTREGMAGYVKGGWKLALRDAAEALGCKSRTAALKRAEKTLTLQQKDAKQQYLEQLRLLQVKYFPLIGRKVSAKAMKQANKRAAEVEVEQEIEHST